MNFTNQDIIYVYDDSGNNIKMEVVSTFNIDIYDSNYIIYRDLDKSSYYVDKFSSGNIINLNTDFDDEELRHCLLFWLFF